MTPLALAYDKVALNHEILLDLPFREGVGVITHDMAKPHHIASGAGHAPDWESIAHSGIGVLDFNGIDEYLEIPAADSQDLDFTGDFTLAAWIYPVYTASAMVIMCRNGTNTGGWCMFLFNNPTLGPLLSFRTNQAGSHTECYAAGFTGNIWQLVGFSRDSAGLIAPCYRNGLPITTVYGPSGILDPVACGATRKLLVGVQDGEIMNEYGGKMWRPRAWPRKYEPDDWKQLFEQEGYLFGA